MTVDAATPSGGMVTYAVPGVTDGDTTSVVATCTPTPGSDFAIGVNTVTCTATDPDDSPSSVTSTFTVTVKGAAAQLVDLASAVAALPPGNTLRGEGPSY
ncbi:MAG: HYR domain-containing protein [Acidimicrobiales bacterium]